jgi:hypothetical protein
MLRPKFVILDYHKTDTQQPQKQIVINTLANHHHHRVLHIVKDVMTGSIISSICPVIHPFIRLVDIYMIGEFQLSIFYTTFYTQMAKHITNLFGNFGSLTKGNQAIKVKRLFQPYGRY